MTTEENRKIADIVEAFGKINQDIYEAFNAMSNSLKKKKKFQEWKKQNPGTRGGKENYYDFRNFLNGESNWYYLNFYGTIAKKVIGFTFVIAVEYDEETDQEYKKFIEKLDNNLNLTTPMLCIYGIYEPIDPKKIYIIDNTPDTWNYVDDIIRMTEYWKDFNLNEIAYKKQFNVTIDCFDKENNTVRENFIGWYKSAKVKIIPITEISSEEKAEEIIDDLIKIYKADTKTS